MYRARRARRVFRVYRACRVYRVYRVYGVYRVYRVQSPGFTVPAQGLQNKTLEKFSRPKPPKPP